ncbi:hypothetical protein BJV82DRAFT_598635 [Fennellomyces sp. T-0311]|nr:hypothetical protein BJV82DRAFT_598635 [Fennellomyces sp. T-0311]
MRLSLISSAIALLSVANFASAGKLNKRSVSSVASTCPLDESTQLGRLIYNYSGYFQRAYYGIAGDYSFGGPVTVRGDYENLELSINADRYINCGAGRVDFVTFNKDKVAISGVDGNKDVHAVGNQLVSVDGRVDLSNGCQSLYQDNPTGIYNDFITDSVVVGSIRLANLTPNMLMDETGKIIDKGSTNSNYKVFTFNTCGGGHCPVAGDLSDPSIFEDNGKYVGPSGDVPSPEETVVFNIPVDPNSVFNITNVKVSEGFYPCRTIYNFYPVGSGGNYDSQSTFTLLRSKGDLKGFTVAPKGLIRDGAEGSFIGTLAGYDYDWQEGVTNKYIRPYSDSGIQGCDNFQGCFAVAPVIGMPYVTVTVTNSEAPVSTTTIDAASTIFVHPYDGNKKGKEDWRDGKDWKDSKDWKDGKNWKDGKDWKDDKNWRGGKDWENKKDK